jgi:iron complex outermembrane receptor protein
MKFFARCLLSVVLTGVCFYSYAQTGSSSVKGKVLGENKVAVEYATVILLKSADSAIVKSSISSTTGLFRFDNIKAGAYIILVHKIGYARYYTSPYKIAANSETDAGEINLQPLNTELQQVTVTDKRDYIELLPDKTVLNVDKSIMAAGNTVFDILNTAPGVRINDNAILFKGGQRPLITIDGKPISSFSDEQMADLLKSYQSDMVSQIELIENPSAKYDAAGGGGVINIILKKNKNLGFKASVSQSAAVGQDYKFNTGLNLNYNTEKLNLFGNFNFSDNKVQRFLDLDRIITGDGLSSNYDLNYKNIFATKNYGFNGGADYKINSKQTVGVLVYGYTIDLGGNKTNTTNIQNNGVMDSVIDTKSYTNRKITNINYNVNYRGSFGKDNKSALSADFDYSSYVRNSDQMLQSDFFTAAGDTYRDPLFYNETTPSNINVRSEKVDFTQQLSKTGSLGLGIKNSQVNSNNNVVFEEKSDTGSYMPVPSLTDHFIYNERINAAYASYTDKFNKTSINIGLRAEQTNSYGKSVSPNNTTQNNYFDLFPNVIITQPTDTNNSITIGYNRRITRPDYQDLNPFVAYIDQYAYTVGNPFLKPEFTDTYEVTEVYKNKLKVTFSIIKTNDFYISIFQQNDSTRVYTTTNRNIGTYLQYMAEFSFPLRLYRWWNADVYLEGGFDRFAYIAAVPSKSTYDFSLNITQDFSITNNLKAEVTGEYDAPTYYGITYLKSLLDIGGGISQTILKGSGSIKLAVSDVFNSDGYKYHSNYLNLDLTGREQAATRFVTATFTYRFGKQSVNTNRQHQGGDVDDQRRLGGGN